MVTPESIKKPDPTDFGVEPAEEPIRTAGLNANLLKEEFKALWASYDPLNSYSPDVIQNALADLFCNYNSLPEKLKEKSELEKAVILEEHIDKLKNAALKLRVFTASTESKKNNILAKLQEAERKEFAKKSKAITGDILKTMETREKKVKEKEAKKKKVAGWKAKLAEIADEI